MLRPLVSVSHSLVRAAFCFGALALVMTAGCRQQESITVYTIPTDVPAELQPGQSRMLAAMVPRGQETWFFKVLGPENAVDSVTPQFRDFVESIEFEEEGPRLDDLPEGWRRGADKPMRHATLDINTPGKQLEVSVTTLSRQDDWDAEVAMNVNRWRGQVGLEPSQEKWAGGEPLTVASADATAVWVDLVGEESGSAMTPPFAAMMPGGGPPAPGPTPAAGVATGSTNAKLISEAPAGWRKGPDRAMRWESYRVGPEDGGAEVTVIPAGGDVRSNVARWLGQVRGGSVPDEVVDEAMAGAESLQVDGKPAQRFILTADPPESHLAIDATIIPMEGGMSLFIKLTGPYEIVVGEDDSMRNYLASLRFR